MTVAEFKIPNEFDMNNRPIYYNYNGAGVNIEEAFKEEAPEAEIIFTPTPDGKYYIATAVWAINDTYRVATYTVKKGSREGDMLSVDDVLKQNKIGELPLYREFLPDGTELVDKLTQVGKANGLSFFNVEEFESDYENIVPCFVGWIEDGSFREFVFHMRKGNPLLEDYER